MSNEIFIYILYNVNAINNTSKEVTRLTFHNEPIATVAKQLSSDLNSGLTDAQASEKLAAFGENRLKEKKKKSNLQRFLDQFKDVLEFP